MGRGPSGDVGEGTQGADDEAARAARGVRHRRLEHVEERVRLLSAHIARRCLDRCRRGGDRAGAGRGGTRRAGARRGSGAGLDGGRACRRVFLPGEDGRWVEDQRRDLRDVLVRALECLRDAALAEGGFGNAVRYAAEITDSRAFPRDQLPRADAGARRRRQPGRGAPRVRALPALPRRRARRLPFAGVQGRLSRDPPQLAR